MSVKNAVFLIFIVIYSGIKMTIEDKIAIEIQE